MPKITDAQLDADQALCDAARKGRFDVLKGSGGSGMTLVEYKKPDLDDRTHAIVERLPAYIAEVRRLRAQADKMHKNDALLAEVERLRKEISASKFFAEQRGLGKDHKFFMELIHTRPGKINEQDIKWAKDQIIEPQEPKND